jgi:hypothetical protein
MAAKFSARHAYTEAGEAEAKPPSPRHSRVFRETDRSKNRRLRGRVLNEPGVERARALSTDAWIKSLRRVYFFRWRGFHVVFMWTR